MKNLSGSIALTKLISVVTKIKNQKGDMVDAIIIPIDANHITRGNKGALYLNLRVYLRDEPDQYDQDGFISQSVDSKKYKDATEDQKEKFKALPILGNIKDFSGTNDTGGVQPENSVKEIMPPDDGEDLPF